MVMERPRMLALPRNNPQTKKGRLSADLFLDFKLVFAIQLFQFSGASQDAYHAVVAFVAGVFVDWFVDSRQGIFAAERRRKKRRVIYGKSVDQFIAGLTPKGFSDGHVVNRHAP
jgi:hypothetical protein